MMEDNNNAPDNYNRVNAWTDDQFDVSHGKEWKEETDLRNQGGYVVASQKKMALMQREKADEEAFQANEKYRKDYIKARKSGYTEAQAKNFARVEKDTGDVYNFENSGPASYAQRFGDNQFLMTPDTPDDYNREHAWTNDQALHYNEATYEAETIAPTRYQTELGA